MKFDINCSRWSGVSASVNLEFPLKVEQYDAHIRHLMAYKRFIEHICTLDSHWVNGFMGCHWEHQLMWSNNDNSGAAHCTVLMNNRRQMGEMNELGQVEKRKSLMRIFLPDTPLRRDACTLLRKSFACTKLNSKVCDDMICYLNWSFNEAHNTFHQAQNFTLRSPSSTIHVHDFFLQTLTIINSKLLPLPPTPGNL